MRVLKHKILQDYINIADFCEKENIARGTFEYLDKKGKPKYWHRGSKVQATYAKLKKLGYLEEDEQEVA